MSSAETNAGRLLQQLEQVPPEKRLELIAKIQAGLDEQVKAARAALKAEPEPKPEPISGMPMSRIRRFGPTGFHRPR